MVQSGSGHPPGSALPCQQGVRNNPSVWPYLKYSYRAPGVSVVAVHPKTVILMSNSQLQKNHAEVFEFFFLDIKAVIFAKAEADVILAAWFSFDSL